MKGKGTCGLGALLFRSQIESSDHYGGGGQVGGIGSK